MELPREWPSPGVSATGALAGIVPSGGVLDLAALARILFLSAGVVRVVERPDGRRYLLRAAGSAGGRFPLELYVSARGVDGVPDGVHWYHPADHALLRVGPPAQDGATTLIATGVPWHTAWRYSERGFRHIYWDGGTMLAQTLLLAETAGLRPRLWTRFPDAEVARLVGADGTHEFPIWLVALGDEPAIRAGRRRGARRRGPRAGRVPADHRRPARGRPGCARRPVARLPAAGRGAGVTGPR